MPYDGNYKRSGNGLPVQIAVLPALLVVFGLRRQVRSLMRIICGKGRVWGVYILGAAMALGCVFGQWIMPCTKD